MAPPSSSSLDYPTLFFLRGTFAEKTNLSSIFGSNIRLKVETAKLRGFVELPKYMTAVTSARKDFGKWACVKGIVVTVRSEQEEMRLVTFIGRYERASKVMNVDVEVRRGMKKTWVRAKCFVPESEEDEVKQREPKMERHRDEEKKAEQKEVRTRSQATNRDYGYRPESATERSCEPETCGLRADTKALSRIREEDSTFPYTNTGNSLTLGLHATISRMVSPLSQGDYSNKEAALPPVPPPPPPKENKDLRMVRPASLPAGTVPTASRKIQKEDGAFVSPKESHCSNEAATKPASDLSLEAPRNPFRFQRWSSVDSVNLTSVFQRMIHRSKRNPSPDIPTSNSSDAPASSLLERLGLSSDRQLNSVFQELEVNHEPRNRLSNMLRAISPEEDTEFLLNEMPTPEGIRQLNEALLGGTGAYIHRSTPIFGSSRQRQRAVRNGLRVEPSTPLLSVISEGLDEDVRAMLEEMENGMQPQEATSWLDLREGEPEVEDEGPSTIPETACKATGSSKSIKEMVELYERLATREGR